MIHPVTNIGLFFTKPSHPGSDIRRRERDIELRGSDVRTGFGELKPFECQMCGTCCKGEGGVFITEEELPGIARFLNMPVEQFERKHCIRKNGRIYIRTRSDGYCSLWDDGCTVHPVKPKPCREWPFFKAMMSDIMNWEVAKQNCPGVNPDATYEEFLAQGRLEAESES